MCTHQVGNLIHLYMCCTVCHTIQNLFPMEAKDVFTWTLACPIDEVSCVLFETPLP